MTLFILMIQEVSLELEKTIKKTPCKMCIVITLIAIWKPWPSLPIRLAAGTLQSSKMT